MIYFAGTAKSRNSCQTFSMRSIQACRSMPKLIISHTMPSFLYSSCSSTNIKWLKNCCSFSLVKLIHNCSKPLYSKVSKPAMSKTPMKWSRLCSLASSVKFTTSTSQLKQREQMALLSACTALPHCSLFWPLLTYSLPTFVVFCRNKRRSKFQDNLNFLSFSFIATIIYYGSADHGFLIILHKFM